MSASSGVPQQGAELVVRAVKDLAAALRAMRMYPANSPTVLKTTTLAASGLRAAAGDGQLELDILPQALSWSPGKGDPVTLPHEELGRRLHLHGVGGLSIAASVTLEGVECFLSSLLIDREDLDGPHPLATGDVAGFAATALELHHLFDDGDERLEGVGLWDRVLQGFGSTGHGVRWREVGSDPKTLAELLAWSLSPESQPEELRQHSQADLFGLICQQVAQSSTASPEVTLQTIVQAVSSIFDHIDSEAWLQILSEPLPITVGVGDDRVEIDLCDVLARALSANQLEKVAGYAMESRPDRSPRLRRFLQKAVAGRADHNAIVSRALGGDSGSESERFGEAWSGLMDASDEDIRPYVDSDYDATLNDALERQIAAPPWPASVLRGRKQELEADAARLAMARVTHALLSRENSDDDYPTMMRAMVPRLDAIVRCHDVDLLEEIVSTIARDAEGRNRSEAHRQAAAAALEHLRRPEFICSVIDLMADHRDLDFHALWRVIDHLGPACLPHILDSMGEHPTVAHRHQLARILRQEDSPPVEMLRERLQDSRPAFVRDLVMVIAEIGGPEVLELLRSALTHPDSAVRSCAIVGFGQYPAEISEKPLLDALSDDALEVRVAALRGFRELYADDSQGRLIGLLQRPNLTGRNTRIIAAAAKALARVGDAVALPSLRSVARGPWLFRRRRQAATLAARAAHRAVEQRLEQRPDRVLPAASVSPLDAHDKLAA